VAPVNLQVAYTELPDKPSPAFPDRTRVRLPLVTIGIAANNKALRARALLDTGCYVTLFGSKYADALGIDWRSCPTTPLVGVGSPNSVGYVASVHLYLPSVRFGWDTEVQFSEAADLISFPLLGHIGFFENFEVRFKAHRSFQIHSK